MRLWGLVALGSALAGVLGAILSLIPGLGAAAILIPIGALIWWFVGACAPKSG